MDFMEPLTYCYFLTLKGDDIEQCVRFAAPELFHGRPMCQQHQDFVARAIEDEGAAFVTPPVKKVRAV